MADFDAPIVASAGDIPVVGSSYKHPRVVVAHLAFRTAAVVVYLFCGLVNGDGFVTNFITIVTLLAFDFWTVKNISGRLLVGLRWWNKVSEDGKSEWVYESRKDNSLVDPTESRLFWWSLYIFTAVWIFFLIASIFYLSAYVVVGLIAVSLNMSNVMGYTRCDKDQKAKITSYATRAGASVVSTAAGSLFSSLLGGGKSDGGTPA